MKLEFNDRRAQKAAERSRRPDGSTLLPSEAEKAANEGKAVPAAGERSDRRRYPRLEAPVECIYISDRQTIVKTFANITIRGIFIDTPDPDPAGTRALLRIGVPGREGMIMAAGEVVWKRDEKSSSVLKGRGMGVRFTTLDEEGRKVIAAYLISRGGLNAFPQLRRKFPIWI